MKKNIFCSIVLALGCMLFSGCAGLVPIESDLSYLLFTSPQEYKGKKVDVYLDNQTHFNAKVSKPVTAVSSNSTQVVNQKGSNNSAVNNNNTVVGNNNTVINNTTIVNNNTTGSNSSRSQAGNSNNGSGTRRTTGVRSTSSSNTRVSGTQYGVASGTRRVTVKNESGQVVFDENVSLERNTTRAISLP